MRWPDRALGIVLGAVLGVGIVAVFVFVYSEQTVDAPSISGGQAGGNAGGGGQAGGGGSGGGQSRGHAATPPPVATVRVIGGAPPASGPPELKYHQGDRVRLRVVSDVSLAVQLLGYGISRTIGANQPTLLEFKAQKKGNFPLIVTASHIDVARITVGRPPM
jgi:hypothetical protein